jgi:hypothetical protein
MRHLRDVMRLKSAGNNAAQKPSTHYLPRISYCAKDISSGRPDLRTTHGRNSVPHRAVLEIASHPLFLQPQWIRGSQSSPL